METNDKTIPRGEVRDMKQAKKTKSALWRRLALAALGILLGVNAYLANARGLAGNQMPMPFGFGTAVVLSGSMEPALKVDDLVIVQEKKLYEVGDIVVYQSGNELIVHRIIARDGSQIITQGDANAIADDPVEISAVKGAVTAHIPFLGTVVRILRRPVVWILLILCAFVLMERSFQTEKRADEQDLEAIKGEIRRLKAELRDEEPKA